MRASVAPAGNGKFMVLVKTSKGPQRVRTLFKLSWSRANMLAVSLRKKRWLTALFALVFP